MRTRAARVIWLSLWLTAELAKASSSPDLELLLVWSSSQGESRNKKLPSLFITVMMTMMMVVMMMVAMMMMTMTTTMMVMMIRMMVVVVLVVVVVMAMRTVMAVMMMTMTIYDGVRVPSTVTISPLLFPWDPKQFLCSISTMLELASPVEKLSGSSSTLEATVLLLRLFVFLVYANFCKLNNFRFLVATLAFSPLKSCMSEQFAPSPPLESSWSFSRVLDLFALLLSDILECFSSFSESVWLLVLFWEVAEGFSFSFLFSRLSSQLVADGFVETRKGFRSGLAVAPSDSMEILVSAAALDPSSFTRLALMRKRTLSQHNARSPTPRFFH